MTGSATWRRLTVKGRVTPPLECAKVTVKVECRSRPKHVSCVGVNEVTFSIALSTIRWFFIIIKDCGGFVFSMKALKKVEKCNELIDIHWPIKGPERHFALMVSPYMYNIYTMRIINNLLTRKAKRKMKRRKKTNAYSYFYKCPRESSYFWNIDGEVFHTEVPRPEWAVARDLVAPQHTRAAPSPLKSG